MEGGLQGAMRGTKDAALAFALRTYVNGRLAAIGEVTALAIDTGRRRARVRLLLRGEAIPVDVAVRKYALDRADGQDWLTLVEVDASRAWLAESLRRFAVGRPLPIAPVAARALRLLT